MTLQVKITNNIRRRAEAINHLVRHTIGIFRLTLAGKAITSRAIMAQIIIIIIIIIRRDSILDPIQEEISWGHMGIGTVGTIIGVTQIFGRDVGALIDMTHTEVGIAIIFGITTQANGMAGAAGSLSSWAQVVLGAIPTIIIPIPNIMITTTNMAKNACA